VRTERLDGIQKLDDKTKALVPALVQFRDNSTFLLQVPQTLTKNLIQPAPKFYTLRPAYDKWLDSTLLEKGFFVTFAGREKPLIFGPPTIKQVCYEPGIDWEKIQPGWIICGCSYFILVRFETF